MAEEAESPVLETDPTNEPSGETPLTSPDAPSPDQETPPAEEGVAPEVVEVPGGEAEGEAEGEGGSPPKAPPDEEPPPGSLLVEIDGKEEEIPIQELVKGYQLARKAHDEIREAKEVREASEAVLKGLLHDHWGTYHRALIGAGADSDQAMKFIVQEARALSNEYAKFEKLPKEQQEVIHLRRKLAEREAQLEEARAREEEEKTSMSLGEAKKVELQNIAQAMKQAGVKVDLNKAATRLFIRDVARKMMDDPGLSHQQAVDELLKETVSELEERLKVADDIDPKRIQGLTPNLLNHIRKTDINGIKREKSARVVAKEPAIKRTAPSKPVVLRDGDWDRFFRGELK